MLKIGLIVAIALVSGCASTPPPVLADAQYESFAREWVVLGKCVSASYMTLDTAAFGRRRINKILGTYQYVPAHMATRIDSYAATFGNVSKDGCDSMSMALLELKQKEQAPSAGASYPTYTTCSKSFYNMTSCTSY